MDNHIQNPNNSTRDNTVDSRGDRALHWSLRGICGVSSIGNDGCGSLGCCRSEEDQLKTEEEVWKLDECINFLTSSWF